MEIGDFKKQPTAEHVVTQRVRHRCRSSGTMSQRGDTMSRWHDDARPLKGRCFRVYVCKSGSRPVRTDTMPSRKNVGTRLEIGDWRFKKTTAEHVVNQGVRHRVPLGCTMSLEWHDVAWHDERLFLYVQNCDFLVLGPLFAKWVKRKRNKNHRNRIVMLY